MASSSLSHRSFVLLFSLLLFSLYIGGADAVVADRAPPVTYHSGPVLSGTQNLVFIWYGKFDAETKNLLSTFVESLHFKTEDTNSKPQVSQWWKVVRNYQKAAGKSKDAPVNVKLSKQVADDNCSIGKTVTMDSVKPLIQKATADNPNALPVIFTAKDVTMDSLCSRKCSQHGLYEYQPYIVVGNPENKCLEGCDWPFKAGKLTPPNGNVGRDALVSVFAQALVNIVTNPLDSGFYQEKDSGVIEAGAACNGDFGTGPMAANVGEVKTDPASKITFNAYGAKGKKFLLPALFNPVIRSCWTLM